VCYVASPLYCPSGNVVDCLSVSQAFYLVTLDIRDSKLYISFIVESRGFVVLRHYALLLRWRFSGETRALNRVERLIVNHVRSKK
jgi:hypothetical protein